MIPQSGITASGQPILDRPVHSAEELTKGRDRAFITLGDQIYTLRITKAGKLILTK